MNRSSVRPRWNFCIDRGGTFTDVVAHHPDGRWSAHKVLSEDPARDEDAVTSGIRTAMQLPRHASLPWEEIGSVRMGTTVATNALLERKGERVALLVTRGFADALRIAYQARPRLFAREIVLPEVLYQRVCEITERISAQGEVLTAIDLAAAKPSLEALRAEGFDAVAIAFMHAWCNPSHEAQLAEFVRTMGFRQVSVSHETSSLIKFVSRADTTVVDAYLSPVLTRYVEHVAQALSGVDLLFMQSSGGLADARHFRGKDALLSGPAGGIVGAARVCEAAGFPEVITFDMGGTSTDVAHYAGEFERSFETEVAGVRVRAPMMKIHTVAAGGGSILSFDGMRFRVGPESAGAVPGPACYGRGGPLTVTDANLLLGRLQPAHFPRVFGADGRSPLDLAPVRAGFASLRVKLRTISGEDLCEERIAEGFLAIAVENMTKAIKRVSVERGHDVTRYALCAFGGAGGQHACAVAEALGMTRVLIHPLAGVLSAFGMGLAAQGVLRQRTVECPLDTLGTEDFERVCGALENEAVDALKAQVTGNFTPCIRRKLLLKYAGTDTSHPVEAANARVARERFEQQHRALYGFIFEDRTLVIDAVAVEVTAPRPTLSSTTHIQALKAEHGHASMFVAGEERRVPLRLREDLAPNEVLEGPCLIVESNACTVLEPGWSARVAEDLMLILERHQASGPTALAGTGVDPVHLEIFNNRFMSIAEQMGGRLRNTAQSVNIKERLDFSCAIFDARGALIANAPHIPVHLGSMGESVRVVLETNRDRMRAGDSYVLNAPYNGGTHLPDITVITPVFDDAGTELLFFAGSRGHHADIGGTTPGSMPSDSTLITEEGVLLDNVKLVDGGIFNEKLLRKLLSNGPWPSRNVEQNLADLRAQVAANTCGVAELRRLVASHGLDVVRAYVGHVQDNAEEMVRRVIATLGEGEATHPLDNGAHISVKITVDRQGRSACIDFAGTSPMLANNFNAPSSVVQAAVMYVFRTLVDDEIPLNAGCLRPLDIRIPLRSMLAPENPAAVVAGNVETSQAITDVLYAALGVMAGAQGTMNNFTFGNERYQYYETIAGGSGAGPGYRGADVVQTHMTNSRLTDPEVLEFRFPVVLESFSIRAGSGGRGQWRGGHGASRRVRFLEPMVVNILSSHRLLAPQGMVGGLPGARGRNTLLRASGETLELGPVARVAVAAGDVVIIDTPGGGGWGVPEPSEIDH